MYYVLSFIDDTPELVNFSDSKKAYTFAREVAGEGIAARVLQTLHIEYPDGQEGQDMAAFNGVRPGIDFPATL